MLETAARTRLNSLYIVNLTYRRWVSIHFFSTLNEMICLSEQHLSVLLNHDKPTGIEPSEQL